jgi:hypothetical protein
MRFYLPVAAMSANILLLAAPVLAAGAWFAWRLIARPAGGA